MHAPTIFLILLEKFYKNDVTSFLGPTNIVFMFVLSFIQGYIMWG